MATATTTTRAPRGTKTLAQAFFAAADEIPEDQRGAVVKAALTLIRDDIKAVREKAAVAKTKAKAKTASASSSKKTGRPASSKVKAKAPVTKAKRAAATPKQAKAKAASKSAAKKRTANVVPETVQQTGAEQLD